MAAITFRNASRTVLNLDALQAIVEKFSILSLPLVISFDRKIASAGYHNIDTDADDKQFHYIRISTRCTEHLSHRDQEFEIISTLLHELAHAMQFESLGTRKFNADGFAKAGTSNQRINEYYSVCETDARLYENLHLHDAVKFYEQFIAKIPRNH